MTITVRKIQNPKYEVMLPSGMLVLLSEGEALELMRKLNKELGFIGPGSGILFSDDPTLPWSEDDPRWQQL